MSIKVFISGISGNKEVKKRQQRVLLILDSKNVQYEVIDIAEPENEDKKDFMQNNSKSSGATISDPNPRHPLPPQIFNGDEYCGDYDQFDMANEVDEMEKFLKLEPSDSANQQVIGNGELHPTEKNDTKEDQVEEEEEKSKDENLDKDENVVQSENGAKVEEEKNEEEEEVDEDE